MVLKMLNGIKWYYIEYFPYPANGTELFFSDTLSI